MRYSCVSFSILGDKMDTKVGLVQPKKVENLSQKKLDSRSYVPSSTVAADRVASLGPITPDSNRESGDFTFDFTSPLTLVSSPPNAVRFDSHPRDSLHFSVDGSSPCTPKEAVFDPFAPGPDKLMLAPYCKKYLEESRRNVARRLSFDSSVDFIRYGNHDETDTETILDDEILLETVHKALLEAIVSKQTEGLLAEILALGSDSDGFKTPMSATRLSGIAETCPGVPVKPTRKLRSIDQGICRKLEF